MAVTYFGRIKSSIKQPSVLPARREFLKWLAASPCVASLGGIASFIQQTSFAESLAEGSNLLANPSEALTVFDFEETARSKVLAGHWAYMASG